VFEQLMMSVMMRINKVDEEEWL